MKKEPYFKKLDDLLEKICPQMSIFQYNRICSKIVKYDEYFKYGERKFVKYVKIDYLYSALIEERLIGIFIGMSITDLKKFVEEL